MKLKGLILNVKATSGTIGAAEYDNLEIVLLKRGIKKVIVSGELLYLQVGSNNLHDWWLRKWLYDAGNSTEKSYYVDFNTTYDLKGGDSILVRINPYVANTMPDVTYTIQEVVSVENEGASKLIQVYTFPKNQTQLIYEFKKIERLRIWNASALSALKIDHIDISADKYKVTLDNLKLHYLQGVTATGSAEIISSVKSNCVVTIKGFEALTVGIPLISVELV